MRPVDEKIVKMTLQNEEFKRRANETVGLFAKLNSGLGDSANLSKIAQGISAIEKRFSVTGVAIATIIANITKSALNMGKNLLGAVIGPLVEGGKKRALNIEQAKFQFQGLGMDVEATMASALAAVKGTAYGLDEAAVVASQFGASGMRAGDDMTAALRGISGVAAMTGSSYTDIGNIFTSVAGNGRLMGNDLLRLSSRGINAAATLAKSMGITEEAVRKMVTEGKISFEMFAESMNDSFGEHATRANETYAGSLSNVKAALSRIGAAIYAPEFTNKRDIFNAVTPKIDALFAAIKPLIAEWTKFSRLNTDSLIRFIEKIDFDKFVKLGGINKLIVSFWNVIRIGRRVLDSIREGFEMIFPPMTVETLVGLIAKFNAFTKNLIMSKEESGKLAVVFAGVFSIFSSAWGLVKELGMAFAKLLPPGLGTSVLDIGVRFAEMAIEFNKTVKAGNAITNFIQRLGDKFAEFSKKVKNFKLGALDFGELTKATGIFEAFGKALDWLKGVLGTIAEPFKEFFKSLTFKDVLAGGGIAGAFILLKKFGKLMDSLTGTLSGPKKLFDSLTGLFGKFGDALKAFTSKVKYDNLLKIAVALGILAVSMVILSKVDWPDINKGLFIIIAALAGLVTAYSALSKVNTKGFGSVKIVAVLIALSIAIGVIAVAVRMFKNTDAQQMMTGLMAVGGIVAILVTALKVLSKQVATMKFFDAAKIAVSLMALSVSVGLMALSMKLLSKIDGDALVKGGLAMIFITGVLGGVFFALSHMKSPSLKMMVSFMAFTASLGSIAIAMVIFTAALHILIPAIRKLGEMDLAVLQQGLIGMIFALGGVGVAMKIAKGSFGGAVGLVVAAVALNMILPIIERFGKMDTTNLAIGMGAVAVSLGLLVISLILANGSMGGAIALVVAAGALNLLVIPILALSKLSLKEVGIAILALAGSLAVIGLVAAIFTPIIPAIIGFAIAVALIGGAVVLAGIGLTLLGTGLTIFAASAAASIVTILATFEALLDGIISIIPKVGTLITTLILTIAKNIVTSAPALGIAAGVLILTMLKTIASMLPAMLAIGSSIIIAFLVGIALHIPQIVMAAINVIIAFIAGMSEALKTQGPRIIQEVMKLIGEMMVLVVDAAIAVFDALFGLIPGVSKILADASDKAGTVIRDRFDGETLGAGMTSDVDKGLKKNMPVYRKSGTEVAKTFERGVLDIDMKPTGEKKGLEFGIGSGSDIVTKLLGKSGLGDGGALMDGFDLNNFMGTGKDGGMDLGMGAMSPDVQKMLKDAGITDIKAVEDGFKSSDTKAMGADSIKKTADGIKSQAPTVKTASKFVADEGLKGYSSAKSYETGLEGGNKTARGLRDTAGANLSSGKYVSDQAASGSKSVNLYAVGKYLGDQNVSGMRSAGGSSKTAGKYLSDQANSGSKSVNAYGAGTDFGQGFANGIAAMRGRVMAAAQDLANVALSKTKNVIMSRSPSKATMKLGGYFGEGFQIGIMQKTKSVGEAAAEMAGNALDAVDGFISEFAEAFIPEEEEAYEFRLKPIIDLDAMEPFPDQKFRLTPDTSNASRQVGEVVNQNGNSFRGADPRYTDGGTTNSNSNAYNINITANGDLPDSTIKKMANRIQLEIKNANDRDRMSKGEVVYY